MVVDHFIPYANSWGSRGLIWKEDSSRTPIRPLYSRLHLLARRKLRWCGAPFLVGKGGSLLPLLPWSVLLASDTEGEPLEKGMWKETLGWGIEGSWEVTGVGYVTSARPSCPRPDSGHSCVCRTHGSKAPCEGSCLQQSWQDPCCEACDRGTGCPLGGSWWGWSRYAPVGIPGPRPEPSPPQATSPPASTFSRGLSSPSRSSGSQSASGASLPPARFCLRTSHSSPPRLDFPVHRPQRTLSS